MPECVCIAVIAKCSGFCEGSGQIEFEEFVTLASKFIVEEDAESLQKELKEAFRLYDKEGKEPYFSLSYMYLHGRVEIFYPIGHDERWESACLCVCAKYKSRSLNHTLLCDSPMFSTMML